MLTNRQVNLLILFCCVILLGNLEGRFLKIKSISCNSSNENFAIFKTCHVKAVKRDVTEMSVYVKLLQPPASKVKVSVLLKPRNDHRNRSLFEYHIDACAFLRNKRRNQIADLFYNLLGVKTHSNINHTCPYNHDIYIDRYSINNKLAPSIPLPIGSFGIYATFLANDVELLHITVFIEASESIVARDPKFQIKNYKIKK